MTLFDQARHQARLWLPALAVLTVISLPAQVQAQDQAGPGAGGHPPQGRPPGVVRQPQAPGGQPQAQGPRQGPLVGQPGGALPRAAIAPQGRPPQSVVQGRPPGPGPVTAGRGPDARFARGAVGMRDYGGHPYRGRVGWEGGRWRHEVHHGRPGWWWDVGGVWYYYPEPMEGPPSYVSEDYADDVVYAPATAYEAAPPPVAYEPAPPADPDPGASALGGAIIGGVLGGILTGKAGGAAAGAVIGGATGAIAGATAASRPGYYLSQGNCYYRYPSGEYVAVDPRSCY
ncbi:MAG: hypothetical protein WA418_22135 [Bradyrhizobium sp.]